MRRLIAVLIVAGIAAGAMWACVGDATSPSSIAGTYILQTFDGERRPAPRRALLLVLDDGLTPGGMLGA